MPMTLPSRPRPPSRERCRSAGRRCSGATAAPTAPSSIPCARPASIAARPAPRGWRGARTSRFHASCADGRARRLPRLQALPARTSRRWPSARRRGRRGLPPHRRGRGACRASPRSPTAAGLSRFHFHRVFKAVTGVTPQGLRARRIAPSACATSLPRARHGDRGDLRRRLQFERPLLCRRRRRCSA